MKSLEFCQVCQRAGNFQREGQSQERSLAEGQELHSRGRSQGCESRQSVE